MFERSLPKNQKLMDEKLFKKIIDELADINYFGRISPHFYGEPLLDERIVDFMEYTRKKLPASNIVIFTNGDLLTIELYNRLINAGIDYFLVTQHGKNMSKNMEDLFEHLKNHGGAEKIHYRKFTSKSSFSSRGGLLDFQPETESWCRLSAHDLVIDYAGNVVLCCEDYHSSIKFGNLNSESIIDIYTKERYRTIRKELKKGIFRLDICKKCVGITK
jgi:radical SAM protein with 4Fe4S-binding SPASM domain